MVTTTHLLRRVKQAYTAEATDPDGLTVKEDDIVKLLADPRDDGWVTVKNVKTNKQGLVPSDYLEEIARKDAKEEAKEEAEEEAKDPLSLSQLLAELRTPEQLFHDKEREKFIKELGSYVGSQWDAFPLPLQQAMDDAITLASTWESLKWGKSIADFADSYNHGRHLLSSSH